jgi:hypothetical protein
MFLDAMIVQGTCAGHGKVLGPKCSAGPGAFSDSYSTYSFTPLLITVVARRSPKGVKT